MKFNTLSVYTLLQIWSEIKVCAIKSNRKVDKQIAEKLETCSEVGMQTPALFASPKLAHEAGYTLVDVLTNKDIPEKDIDKYDVVILEGNTRFWAWFNSLVKNADGTYEEKFAYKFIYVEYADAKAFTDAYHQVNLYQVKTTNTDFARDILATGGGNAILESYHKKVDRGLVAKAAGYATYLREFDKKDVMAFQKGKAPEHFKNESILQFTDRVFAATTAAFNCSKKDSKMSKALKGSFVWKWNADKLKDVEKDTAKLEEVTLRLEKMYSTMPCTVMFAISDAKDKPGKTKEQVIHDLLQGLYDSQMIVSE